MMWSIVVVATHLWHINDGTHTTNATLRSGGNQKAPLKLATNFYKKARSVDIEIYLCVGICL